MRHACRVWKVLAASLLTRDAACWCVEGVGAAWACWIIHMQQNVCDPTLLSRSCMSRLAKYARMCFRVLLDRSRINATI